MSNSKRSFFPHFRRAFLLVLVLIVALVVATFAYLTSLPPMIGPRASIVSSPLEFSIELNKAEFIQQGERVNITFSLINTSNKTLTLDWSSYFIAFGQRF